MDRHSGLRPVKSLTVPLLVFAVILGAFWVAINDASSSANEKSLEATRRAINRAAVSCYAIEGRYPPDISYLEEHYGVTYDHDRYIVSYEAFASNIRPVIQVLVKGEKQLS